MKPLSPLLQRWAPLLGMLACLAAGPAFGGTCTSPAGNEGDVKYSGDYHTYQFCNGTSWIAFGPGSCYAPENGAYQPTIPAGSGFFVITSGTYNGNLGGLAGANATCLTELTTHTGWWGYATANANGQLISAKVKAFICTGTNGGNTCNNPTASTTYYFGNAGNSAAGGASFTTNGSGGGPNDNADWAAANYFGGTYMYHSNRATGSSTVWGTTPSSSQAVGSCDDYTSTAVNTMPGSSGSITTTRWVPLVGTGAITCSQSLYLICLVNP